MSLSMARWLGKTAIVTGASSGIGEAVTKNLLSNGVNVVGIARRKDRLDVLTTLPFTGKFHPYPCDISSEESILSAFTFAKTIGPIHILINNAGFMKKSSLVDGDAKSWKDTFDVNVLGLSIATREAVRDMRQNGVDGHIVHLNSVAGHAVPGMKGLNVYPASKFAVTALAGVLRQELDDLGSKIKVTSVSPGIVKTGFYEHGGRKVPGVDQPLAPEDVAAAINFVLSTPPHVNIEELIIRCFEVAQKKKK